MKLIPSGFLLLTLLFSSCKQEQHRKNAPAKTVLEVTGMVMNADTLKPPIVKTTGQPKIIAVPPIGRLSKKSLLPHAFFTNYSTDQGLALSAITSSFYDKAGNLWFGTNGGGVSKYDGHSFTNFTTAQGLANNVVISIAEDKDGNMWFGTYGSGVSKYDGRIFTTISTEQGLAENTVWSIVADRAGTVWFGTHGGGLSKYDGRSFTNYTTKQGLVHNFIWCMTEDRKGNLWIGTDGGGISKFDGKSFTNFTTSEGLANNTVWSIAADKKGNIWCGTYGGGASKYDGHGFTTITAAQGLANNAVWSVAEDKKGNLWFGTYGGGVSKYDGSSFTNFTAAQGLASNFVLSITEDRSGNLWFGTGGAGVSKYSGGCFANYTGELGFIDKIVWSIAEDKEGNLWFATNNGVSRYDGKTFTHLNKNNGLGDNVVKCIAVDKTGNLWFGTNREGVFKYDGKSLTNYTTEQGLANNSVWSIGEDRDGNLWFGTFGGGVSRFDGKTFTSFGTAQGLASDMVRCITEDNNRNLWFGTNGGGLSKYDGKTFTTFNAKHGLPSNVVESITADRNGNFWVASENGIFSFNPDPEGASSGTQPAHAGSGKKAPALEIKLYTIANGLPNNSTVQMSLLASGKLAVGTNVGLMLFDPDQPLDASGKLPGLEVFNVTTGYPLKDINSGQNCLFEDSKGIIWTGTGEEKIGLVRFDYSAINRTQNPPKVVLQNIKLTPKKISYYSLDEKTDSTLLAQQEVSAYDRALTPAERDSLRESFKGIKFKTISAGYPLPQDLVLPYEHNSITFEYNCVEVGNHHMVNYQYMLDGYDKNWGPVLKKQEATYGNLREGTYTFLLKAQSPDGIWCEPISYTFTVLPPWWRTWWMYGTEAVLIILLVVQIVRWNGRKLKARANELTIEVRKATMTIVQQKQLVEEQKKILEEKHREITDSIHYAERIQRALLASKKLLDENLKDYLILFRPKDVVSGDFYWATKLKNNNFLLVTADSTGHGVPGAIMSIVNIASLNAASMKGITSPDLLLNETRRLVIETLKHDGSPEGGKDGMDGSLLSFDFENNILSCASANNPVWIVRNNQLIEIKPDRLPVGKHDRDTVPFTRHTLELQQGDIIYTFTDGFTDQFGGSRGKKFMHKQLQVLLLSIASEPMEVQKRLLNEAFDNWKGNLEQVDDVCLIAVKI